MRVAGLHSQAKVELLCQLDISKGCWIQWPCHEREDFVVEFVVSKRHFMERETSTEAAMEEKITMWSNLKKLLAGKESE
ncbi:hypothetical protein NC652_039802 [Populus alba x Populus x berolinensis]|nr:hypothetical protein NC652_039802 [Populus alba x Populus x berolinensis]